jgi:FlaA1/EpsC-like NDP-sugar epimerase
VVESRGPYTPHLHHHIRRGGPVTITTTDMTRFLLSLEQAVDTVFAAVREARRGGDRRIEIAVTGIRPGEKVHEILVSEEEAYRTTERGSYYVIQPMLPELLEGEKTERPLGREYSSADGVMTQQQVAELLAQHKLLVGDRFVYEEDMLA